MASQGMQGGEECSIENPAAQTAEPFVAYEGNDTAASAAAQSLDQLCLVSLLSEDNKLTSEAKLALQTWAKRQTQQELASDVHRDAMDSVAKGVTATFSEAAPNWHQAGILYARSTDLSLSSRLLFAASCGLMVLLQTFVTVILFASSILQQCASNDHCPPSFFCLQAPGLLSVTPYCQPCGNGPISGSWTYQDAEPFLPLQIDPVTTLVYNTAVYARDTHPEALPFGGTGWATDFNATAVQAYCLGTDSVCGFEMQYDKEKIQWHATGQEYCTVPEPGGPTLDANRNWCDRCAHRSNWKISTSKFIRDNIASMGINGWFTLLLAACVTAVACVAELKDIALCELAIEQANPPLAAGARIYFQCIAIIRRHALLPTLCGVIPGLLFYLGGDSVKICFNTIAALFITEIDNVAYHFLLSDKARVHVERNGRVSLTQAQASKIMVMKTVHAIVIVVDILLVVNAVDIIVSTPDLEQFIAVAPFINFFSFWVAGLVAACFNHFKVPQDIVIDMARTTGTVFAGVIIFVSMLLPMIQI